MFFLSITHLHTHAMYFTAPWSLLFLPLMQPVPPSISLLSSISIHLSAFISHVQVCSHAPYLSSTTSTPAPGCFYSACGPSHYTQRRGSILDNFHSLPFFEGVFAWERMSKSSAPCSSRRTSRSSLKAAKSSPLHLTKLLSRWPTWQVCQLHCGLVCPVVKPQWRYTGPCCVALSLLSLSLMGGSPDERGDSAIWLWGTSCGPKLPSDSGGLRLSVWRGQENKKWHQLHAVGHQWAESPDALMMNQ